MKSVNVCRLPCLGDQFTKQQVCYALRTCSLVFQKCDGCTSGTGTGQKLGLRADKAREAAAAIIRSERLTRLAAARDEL